jgi:hypothetical protein
MKKFFATSALSIMALALVFATGTAEAKSKKMSKKVAAKECKADPATAEGQSLKDCIKAKRK